MRHSLDEELRSPMSFSRTGMEITRVESLI